MKIGMYNIANRKKPYSSATTTTGDIDLNIKHFNKIAGTNDNNNPSTEEAKARKAAETAAKEVGTFASQSPDGASSISTSSGASTGGGESAGASGGDGGSSGGGMGESLNKSKLKEDLICYENINDLQKVFDAYNSCEEPAQKEELKKAVKIALYQTCDMGDEKKLTPEEQEQWEEIYNSVHEEKWGENSSEENDTEVDENLTEQQVENLAENWWAGLYK